MAAVRHDCSNGISDNKKSRKRRSNSRSVGLYRESHRFLQSVVTLLFVVVVFCIPPSHAHGPHAAEETPVNLDISATAFQRQQQQQRNINESDAHLQQKQEQQQEKHTEKHETENTATTSNTNEEEELEVVIKLSSNPPPPPPPVVEMMSHPVQDNVHMDAVTMLSTQIRALSNQIKVHAVLPTLGLCKATIPKSMLTRLQNDAHVAYVEPNDMVFFPHTRQQNRQKQNKQQQQNKQKSRRQPSQKETTPNGIKMAIGHNEGYADPRRFDASTTYNTDTECSIKVGILDSGLDIGHYDFIDWCGVYDVNGMPNPDQQQRCWGKAFLTETELGNGQDWYNPFDVHGTHVAGVIAASGRNGAGLRGMVDDGKICLFIARVFGNFGGASLFQISEAITWVVDQNVRIINMSVGSPTSFTALQDAVDYAEQRGILFIASAGNGAEMDPPYLKNYPSDYPNVLSVAAVNEKDKMRGNFSNFNEHVDISAPGVEIFSSIPRIGLEPFALVSNVCDNTDGNTTMFNVTGIKFEYSRYVNHPGVTGVLVDCGLGLEVCPGPGPVGGGGGHVCFMQRGEIPFIDKALNCERSGAVAAIVVNNEDDIFRGTLGFNNVTGEPNTSRIPIIGVTTIDGNTLLSAMGKKVNFYYPLEGGAFGYQNGTSMAAPHVTGAAALIWRQCQRCTRVEVLDCLLTTAEDLGEPGRDDFYGHGLVQTDMALCCLQQEECCLQPTGAPTTTPYPSPTPTVTPAPTRTISPSTTPSSLPSSMPSISFSPSTTPTLFPTNTPSISPMPSGLPTAFPSYVPSITLEPSQSISPSSVPSVSPKPSNSQFPSWQQGIPSDQPSSLLLD